MHRHHGNGHHHHDHHDHGHAHDHPHDHLHNHPHGPKSVAQWQVPHKKGEGAVPESVESDLDQVEAAFAEGFAATSDVTSFLRLAHIPFELTASGGAKLILLRVETEQVADVGSVTPHLGGESFRYDPLPAKMVTKRRRLRFVYFDGAGLRSLSFSEVRGGRSSG